jgi:hypothetical protein
VTLTTSALGFPISFVLASGTIENVTQENLKIVYIFGLVLL